MAGPKTPDYAGAASPQKLAMDLRVRLSIMMFMQYAIWGVFWSVLSKYLGELKFSPAQIGAAYGTTALASIISPLVFGQIADRWVPTQHLLAGLHLIGALALFLLTQVTQFNVFYGVLFAWALLYFPTITLTNALSFHHIVHVERHFPGIRVFGTIGWIVAGLFVWLVGLNEASVQPIYAAAVCSVILGLFCVALPHTPPQGKTGSAFPALRAVGMLRDPSFLLFIIISFIIAIILAGYFVWTGPFLGDVAKATGATYLDHAAPIMTIGQMFEIVFMLCLPFFLSRLGMKWTLVFGMLAWGVRYGIFALGYPAPLILLGIALHGICYDFFFVAAYIHTDRKASADTRASAQALFNFVVMGLGMFIGSYLFGWLNGYFTVDGAVDWRQFWGYPAIAAVIAIVFFVLLFKEKKQPQTA